MLKWLRIAFEGAFGATVVLTIVAPLGYVLVSPFLGKAISGGTAPLELLALLGTRSIIWRTFLLATVVTLFTAIVGSPLASLIRRLRSRALIAAIALLLVPLFADQLSRNYGWYFILRSKGILNSLVSWLGLASEPVGFLYNFWTVVVVMLQGLYPLFTIPLLLAFLNINPSIETLTNCLGASRFRALLSVKLPLLLPGLILGLCFVFATSLGYYITPRMLGGDAGLTVSGMIDQRVNLLLDWPGAAALGGVLAVGALPFLGLFVFWFNRLEPIKGFESVPALRKAAFAGFWRVLLWISLLVLLLTPLIPVFLGSLTTESFLSLPAQGITLKWYDEALNDPRWTEAWKNSLWVSTLVALASSLVAVGGVVLARRSAALRTMVMTLIAVPLLVAPLALSIGVYRVLAMTGLSYEWFRLAAGQTAKSLPFAFLMLLLSAKSLNPTLIDATRVYAGRNCGAWLRALMPHFLPALVVGFSFSWLVAYSDLEYSLILGGPNSVTLPIKIWTTLNYSANPTVAANAILATVLGCAALALMVTLTGLFYRSALDRLNHFSQP